MTLMDILRVAKEGITHPFGDERSVKQAFPAGIPSKDSDPFLMCDYFYMTEEKGPVVDEDEFPVDWHPHRGFDICTYLRSGTGRHGDSLGNRETFETPGMQWMSTGSGVVHAEGGGTKKGQQVQGFQIWVNTPSERKMDHPRYGTVPPKDLPLVDVAPGVAARVLAGTAWDTTGPFSTSVREVMMIDFELEAGSSACFDIAKGSDTAMLYVYEGTMETVNNSKQSTEIIGAGNIVLFDASSEEHRGVELATSNKGAKAIMFAGKKLKEPIAWHGPIVMNTQSQIQETLRELRAGTFPPVRVDWDYKRIGTKPK